MDTLWGVINSKGEYIDVSNSERGAKCYASRHGYTRVGARLNGGYNISNISVKAGNRWVRE